MHLWAPRQLYHRFSECRGYGNDIHASHVFGSCPECLIFSPSIVKVRRCFRENKTRLAVLPRITVIWRYFELFNWLTSLWHSQEGNRIKTHFSWSTIAARSGNDTILPPETKLAKQRRKSLIKFSSWNNFYILLVLVLMPIIKVPRGSFDSELFCHKQSLFGEFSSA